MTLSDTEISERLKTQIVDFRQEDKRDYIQLRRMRIDEAKSWPGGSSTSHPEKYVVDTPHDEVEAYFLKPGKEADDSDPNPHDMAPRVGSWYDNYRFDETWADIARVGLSDSEMFDYFLILIYRNAYLKDHEVVGSGEIRYRPDVEVVEAVNDVVGDAITGDVLSFLHFLDLLGWNEDVKYHGGSKDYDLNDNFGTGRINTLLTCIDIPYQLVDFIKEVMSHADDPEEIDVVEGLRTMQNLSTTRGVSTPNLGDLEEWFSPTMYR